MHSYKFSAISCSQIRINMIALLLEMTRDNHTETYQSNLLVATATLSYCVRALSGWVGSVCNN